MQIAAIISIVLKYDVLNSSQRTDHCYYKLSAEV